MIWLNKCSPVESGGSCLQNCRRSDLPKICRGLPFAHRMESRIVSGHPGLCPIVLLPVPQNWSYLALLPLFMLLWLWGMPCSPNELLFPCQSPAQISPQSPAQKCLPFRCFRSSHPTPAPSPREERVLSPLLSRSPLVYCPMQYLIMLRCIYLSKFSPPLDSGVKDLGTISDSSLRPQHIAQCLAHCRHTQKRLILFLLTFFKPVETMLFQSTFCECSDCRRGALVAETLAIQKYEGGNEGHLWFQYPEITRPVRCSGPVSEHEHTHRHSWKQNSQSIYILLSLYCMHGHK